MALKKKYNNYFYKSLIQKQKNIDFIMINRMQLKNKRRYFELQVTLKANNLILQK